MGMKEGESGTVGRHCTTGVGVGVEKLSMAKTGGEGKTNKDQLEGK